jgi:hypothetical protein
MNVNLNKKSVKQDGGPSHTMPDGSVMPGATHGESMAPPQQEVDPAIQEVGQYFAQAVQQGSKPEEVIMTLLEQQVDQNIIAQALMMVGYEENELQQLFQTVQELSQPQQASGPEVTRDPQELARNEAIAAEQEGLDVAVEEVDIAKSGIEIKPENKGKFTAWAKARGMSVKEAYTKVMANTDAYPPRIVKMANFAKNAAGFKKQEGGGTGYTEGVRQREGSYNAPNRKYTLDPRFKQEGGSSPTEEIDMTTQLGLTLEDLRGSDFYTGLENPQQVQDIIDKILIPINTGSYSRNMNGVGKFDAYRKIALEKFNQQQSQMKKGGEFEPHFMYKGKRKIRAKDMETHLRLKEAGYNHDAPKAQDGDEIAKAQLIDDKSKGTLRNELFFTPNVGGNGFDLGKVGNTVLKGYNDMFSGDNNNDGIADGSFRDWNKKYTNQIINDAEVSYTPDMSKENINNTSAWFEKFMLENPEATKEEVKTALTTGLSSNNSIDMPSLVQQYGDDRLLNLQTKLKGIGNNILDAGKPVVEDVKNFVNPIINNVKGKIEDYDFSQIGNFFQIGGESDTNGYIPNFEDIFNTQTNYIEDTQNVRDAQLQNQNPGMGATPLQQKQGQSETTSNDLLKKINFGTAKVENLGGVGAAINRGINSPAATAIGDVADFAVQGLGIANDYLEYGNAEEAERNNRAEVYADNLAPVYTNPFNNRGTTDVNTGLMGSEGDRTTGLYAKKGGGVNNAGFKALPPEAQANILQNMQGGGVPGQQIPGMPTRAQLDAITGANEIQFAPMTPQYEFLTSLPEQSVDFQLPNFKKNSSYDKMLVTRLFNNSELMKSSSQSENFELDNFQKRMQMGGTPGEQIPGMPTKAQLDLAVYKNKLLKSFMAPGFKPSQLDFDGMNQENKEMYSNSFPGNYMISSDTPTKEQLNSMAYGGSKGEAAYLANRDAVIKSAMGKAQDGEETPLNRAQLREQIQNIRQSLVDEETHLSTFRNNITNLAKGYKLSKDKNVDPISKRNQLDALIAQGGFSPDIFDYKKNEHGDMTVGNDTIPKPTYNWLNSLSTGYGCTSYGCGIIGEGGALIPQGVSDDFQISGRDKDAGDRFPIVSGNSQLNSIIQNNSSDIGMELMPNGFSDLKPGDRIVSNYGTSGGDGASHTMIFTGNYNDNGSPMMMENQGGYVSGGVSIRSLSDIKGYENTSDPNSGLRVTRYTGNRQNLNNELSSLEKQFATAPMPERTQINSLNPAGIQPIPIAEPDFELALTDFIPRGKLGLEKAQNGMPGSLSLSNVFGRRLMDNPMMQKLVNLGPESEQEVIDIYEGAQNISSIKDGINFNNVSRSDIRKYLDESGIEKKEVRDYIYEQPFYEDANYLSRMGIKAALSYKGLKKGGETVNVDSALLAKLIAAGADIEIL